MGMLDRVSRLMTANLNHLLDHAEDPEVMIKQIIRDMDEGVAALRRETVSAVAREKQLARQLAAAEETAGQVEREAALALDSGDETLARQILTRKIRTLKSRDALGEELDAARHLADQLRRELLQLEEKAQLARRKKDELIRRKRAAEARLRSVEAARGAAAATASGADAGEAAFDGFVDAIGAIEAEADAARELTAADGDAERKLARLLEDSAVEEELAKLRAGKTAGR